MSIETELKKLTQSIDQLTAAILGPKQPAVTQTKPMAVKSISSKQETPKMADVQQALLDCNEHCGKAAVLKILKSYKAERIGQVEESDYAAIIADLHKTIAATQDQAA